MVLYLTLYVLTMALFLRVKVPVFHKTIPNVVCKSRANHAFTQARPIDALHLTSCSILQQCVSE